jgi:hypothetical protein
VNCNAAWCAKGAFTAKDLHWLRAAVYLAQKVGKSLGCGEALLKALQRQQALKASLR